jgi:hypothetical protein
MNITERSNGKGKISCIVNTENLLRLKSNTKNLKGKLNISYTQSYTACNNLVVSSTC